MGSFGIRFLPTTRNWNKGNDDAWKANLGAKKPERGKSISYRKKNKEKKKREKEREWEQKSAIREKNGVDLIRKKQVFQRETRRGKSIEKREEKNERIETQRSVRLSIPDAR